MPKRSPGPIIQVMWSSTRFVQVGALPAPLSLSLEPVVPTCASAASAAPASSYSTHTLSKSTTCLPKRLIAMRLSSSVSRKGGTSSISCCAAFTWNFGFVARALAPRDSHANSRRSLFWRFCSVAAAKRSRSTRCMMYAEKPPSNASTPPARTSHIAVATSSKNHLSCVTTKSAPTFLRQRVFKCSASQEMVLTSKWLVGSSNIKTSYVPIKRRAKSTRLRWPPDRVPT